MWERFSSYDTSVDEAEFARLIEDNFVSASMERGTQRNFIEKIGEVPESPSKLSFCRESSPIMNLHEVTTFSVAQATISTWSRGAIPVCSGGLPKTG